MFINIDLENIKINGKNSLTWFQQNYIRHKYNICKSLSYYNQLWKIDPPTHKKILFLNKRIIPTTPHTTPRKEVQSLFDDNSGWNKLKILDSLETMKKERNIPCSMRISIDRLDYQSPGRLDNISNSSNSTLNSSFGDRLSNLAPASPYLSSSSPQNKSSSSFNSFDIF